MQQEVGIQRQALSLERTSVYHSAMLEIDTLLGTSQFQDKKRGLLVNTMLDRLRRASSAPNAGPFGEQGLISQNASNFSQNEQFPSSLIPIIQAIQALFTTLLDGMRAEKAAADTMLVNSEANIYACNGVLVAEDAARLATALAAEVNHTDCRTEEITYYDEDQSVCQEMVDYMSAYPVPNCVLPTATRAYITEWRTFFSNGLTWFNDTVNDYTPLLTACNAAYDAWQEQRTDCNDEQTAFESDYCQWRMLRHMRCDDLDICYPLQLGIHNGIVDGARTVSDKRVADATLVEHLNCIIASLAHNDVNILTPSYCRDQLAGRQAQVDLQMTTVEPPIRPQDFCNRTETEPSPGTTNWLSTRYANLDPVKSPHDTAVVACAST